MVFKKLCFITRKCLKSFFSICVDGGVVPGISPLPAGCDLADDRKVYGLKTDFQVYQLLMLVKLKILSSK